MTPCRYALAAAGLLAVPTASAQDAAYPERPIRFIVPFAPGGTNDIVARIVAARLHDTLGQPVVVDNRGGASGVVGTELAVRAAPDGHTLLMVNVNLATNPSLLARIPYDAARDLQPVSLLATSPTVLVVHPSFPARSVKELIAHAKAHPGKLTYSTSGAGSTTHIAMALLVSISGVRMVPVHYKGGGPALIDLMAGRVSPGFATVLSVIPHLKAQRLRALAVSTPKRSPALPDLPTVAESGLPGYEFTGWWGMAVPARTPAAVVERLNATLGRILAEPAVRDTLLKQGAAPEHTTPQAFATYIAGETRKWNQVIREAGIRAN